MQNKNLNTKNIIIFGLLYSSLILGFILNEDSTGGALADFGAYKRYINAFLDNFWETFLNYDQLKERHSPVYIMLLSAFYHLNIPENIIRFLNLNFSLISILFFYKCLKLKFKDINNNYLILISLVFFISPTYRSLSIWPDSRIFGFHFFVISTFYYLKFIYVKKEIFYCYLNIFFLALSAYFSINFCVFSIFFLYQYYCSLKFSKKFINCIILNLILAFPAFYYLFVLDIFFLITGATPGNYTNDIGIKNNFNIANKLLIISSIIMFYFLPIILIKKKLFIYTNRFKINEIIFLLAFFLILVKFFNYQLSFTGGGIFLHLSQIIFNNNILFFLISFYSLAFIYKICEKNLENFIIIILIFLSNPQLSIYHKYYDPLLFFLIFSLLNLNLSKSFFKFKNIILIYIFHFFFLFISFIKFIL